MGDGDLADLSREENAQITSYQVNAKLGKHVDAKGYYVQYHGDKSENYFGGAVDTHFGPHSKVWLGGEYSRYEALGAAGEGWTAGIGYGKYDITKPGTWSTKAQYFRLGEASPVTSPTWNLPDISNSNFRGWLGTIDYAVAKNVGITANAQLRGKYLDGYELPDYYRVELNYQF